MNAGRYGQNSTMTLMVLMLITVLSMKSCTVSAQSSRSSFDDSISKKVKVWDDSVRKLKHQRTPVSVGGEMSMAFPQYTLKSKIGAIDGLHVNYIGTNLGGVVGNPIGKLKANVGLYYSEPSVPYSMEMFQGAISGSLYVLRTTKVKYHTFEPYVTLGFARQQTKFYGNYLPMDNGMLPQTNYSVSEQPLLGKAGFTQLNTGIGVEYQLTSCNTTFIHLFAEVGYGVMISSRASNASFSGTRLSNPTTLSLGINFGILK